MRFILIRVELIFQLVLVLLFAIGFETNTADLIPDSGYSYDYGRHSVVECLKNVLSRFVQDRQVVFFREELQQFEPGATEILKNSSAAICIQPKPEMKLVGKAGFFVFLPFNSSLLSVYRTSLASIRQNIDHRFLILIPTNFSDSFIEDAFEIFWNERIANVVALKHDELMNLIAYTFFPFTVTHCFGVGTPVVLDYWQGSEFLDNAHLFPLHKKNHNFHGCTLKGLAKTRPPDAVVYIDPDTNDWVLEGTGGKVLQIAMDKLHFSTNISIPPNNTKIDRFGYDISTGIPNALDEALNKLTVDFAFGIYSHIIYDLADAQFSKPVTEECFTWVVPDKAGRTPSIWSNYISEFDLGVWSLILITFSTTALALYFTTHLMDTSGKFRKFEYILFYEIATSVAVSSPANPKAHSLRLLIFQWLLYCLVISAAYQSSLGSFMTVPWSTEQIKELDQILHSKFNITGQPQAGRILKRSATDNRVLQQLSHRFLIHSGFYDDVIDMVENGTAASFAAKRFIQFYSINRLKKRNAILHIIPECVLLAHSSPFMFKKGSILEPSINRIITGLVEGGITEYWFEYSIPHPGQKLENVRALQMNQIKGLLIILFCGHVVAAAALCGEKALHWWTNQRIRKITFVADSSHSNELETRIWLRRVGLP